MYQNYYIKTTALFKIRMRLPNSLFFVIIVLGRGLLLFGAFLWQKDVILADQQLTVYWGIK